MEAQGESRNPRLCRLCQGWDRWHGIEDYAAPSQYDVSYVQLVENAAFCIVCHFVLSTVDVWEGGHQQALDKSTLNVKVMGPFYFDTKFPVPETSQQNAGLLPERLDLSDQSNITSRVWVQLQIDARDAQGQLLEGGRRVPSLTTTPQLLLRYAGDGDGGQRLSVVEDGEVACFDLGLVKTWIKNCEDHHGDRCVGKYEHKGDMPRGFRVIDVHGMNITAPDAAVSFVALSYMWAGAGTGCQEVQLEKSNLEALETPGGLDGIAIPDIISDAIHLCRNLGQTHLWVDRLCIIQDDPDTKPAQIGAMDKIYRSATLTLVAALNDRLGGGLPGCQGRPRRPRSSVFRTPRRPEVEGRGMNPDGVTALVDRSLWNRRGWTFQERVLSTRRLFITDHQVIYECSVTTAEEELTWNSGQAAPQQSQQPQQPTGDESTQLPETAGSPSDEPAQSQAGFLFPGVVERSRYSSTDVGFYITETPCLGDYCAWVQDYSSRQLSFGTDVVNAFMGVGNIIGGALGTRMLFGLPEKYLAQSLLWSSSALMATGQRGDVPHIPSWSWALSLTRADYHWLGSGQQLLEIASIVEFYFQDPQTGFRKLEVEQRWDYHAMGIAEIAGQAELPPDVRGGKARPADWRSNEIWRECPHNPWQAASRLRLDTDARDMAALFPGSIVFNTTVASLTVRGFKRSSQTVGRDDGSGGGGGGGGGDQLDGVSICTADGQRVGGLIMDRASRGWVNERESADGNRRFFDFVVICGAMESYSLRKWLAFLKQREDMWQLKVMMVERLPCKPFVARRVAVGAVSTYKWKDCNPRWETVVLC